MVVIAAVQLAIHLALNGAYGLHTDELYYIISGRHPALGYVDYPPVTPLLARLNTSIFGVSPWTLRLFPAVTSAATVLLTGVCARELGANRSLSALASLVALVSPYLLATWLFQTVEFDEVLWQLAILLLLRILRTQTGRLFPVLGLVLGVGLETKSTILALCIAVAATVLISSDLRPMLRTRYPWIALAIVVGCVMPNLVWQAANGFPTLTYVASHRSDIAQSGGTGAFIELFILLVGPLLLPLWIAGLALLISDVRFRPLMALVVIPIVLFLPDGKAYYPAPAVPFVLAAGCVAVGRLASPTGRRWAVGLVLAGGILESAILSPIILPLVPASSMHRLGIDKLNPDFANTVGWQTMTDQVAFVYNGLPPEQRANTAIVTSIDGQAGAIDIYGGAEHLPEAISPHLNFWYWKPATLNPSTLVTVGYSPGDLGFLCGSIRRAATVTIPNAINNLNQGTPILVCTDLRESLNAAWPVLRNFS